MSEGEVVQWKEKEGKNVEEKEEEEKAAGLLSGNEVVDKVQRVFFKVALRGGQIRTEKRRKAQKEGSNPRHGGPQGCLANGCFSCS